MGTLVPYFSWYLSWWCWWPSTLDNILTHYGNWPEWKLGNVTFSRVQHELSHKTIMTGLQGLNSLIKYPHHSCFTHNMPIANRPSGSWSCKQEEDLRDLIRNNIVNYRNRNPDYLFEITEEHSPTSLVLAQLEATPQSNACEGNSSSMNNILNSEGLGVSRYVCSILRNGNLITKFCIVICFLSRERTAPAPGPALANVAEAEEAEEAIPAHAFGSPPPKIIWRCCLKSWWRDNHKIMINEKENLVYLS